MELRLSTLQSVQHMEVVMVKTNAPVWMDMVENGARMRYAMELRVTKLQCAQVVEAVFHQTLVNAKVGTLTLSVMLLEHVRS